MLRCALLLGAVGLLAAADTSGDLAKVQGKWEATFPDKDGKAHRMTKEIEGNKEIVHVYGEKGEVMQVWTVDFRLEDTGKVRIFTFFNAKMLEGPNKGKEYKEKTSYLYRVEDDTIAEVWGFLKGQEKMAPSVKVWKRIKH